jgi:hypothetical protein
MSHYYRKMVFTASELVERDILANENVDEAVKDAIVQRGLAQVQAVRDRMWPGWREWRRPVLETREIAERWFNGRLAEKYGGIR